MTTDTHSFKQDILFVRRLRRREYRDQTGLTIIEGVKEVRRAQKANVTFETIYICPEIFQPEKDEFDLKKTVEVSKDIFSEMAFGDRLKGIIVLARPVQYTLSDLKLSENPLVVVLEGVEKPGNIGTVIRTSSGAGVEAVILADSPTDVYNHNIVRSSIGTVFHVPTVSAGQEEVKNFLKEKQIRIMAATSKASKIYTQTDLSGKTAIVVGNEHSGLSPFWLQCADENILIPMNGEAECLNAAISTSILVYESLRQRNLNQFS